MSEREEMLAKAAQDFIDKVDRGEARSKRSYAAFKASLLAPAATPGSERISVTRYWLERLHASLQGPLPPGHIGDVAFLLRDQVKDILDTARPHATSFDSTTDWHPMETAPKDGTWILIWEAGINDKFYPSEIGRFRCNRWETSAGELVNAVAWQPAPTGPSPVSRPLRRCQKCGDPTKGEEAYVNGQIWCHPCADVVVTSQDGATK